MPRIKHNTSSSVAAFVPLVMAAALCLALFASCAGTFAKGQGSAEKPQLADTGSGDAGLDSPPSGETPAAILARHGFNYARLRILVDSAGDYGLGQDLEYVIRSAKEAKAQGMMVLLDFFYSHWWADPGQNWKPETWSSDQAALETQVFEYTRSVLLAMQEAGVPPDMVQVGNEVNNGMLWPAGRLGAPNRWSAYTALSNRGYDGVKSVNAAVPVLIQYAGTGRACLSWYDSFFRNGGKADVLGLSFYEMWHGSMASLIDTLKTLRETYGKDLYVVETAGYWKRSEGGGKTAYAHTQEGQYRFLYDLTASLRQVSGVRGLMYWGAAWTQSEKWLRAPDWKDDDAGCRGLFDDEGRATQAVTAISDAGGLEFVGADLSEALKARDSGVIFLDRP